MRVSALPRIPPANREREDLPVNYAILTDAACDLDASVTEREGLAFIPMEYSLGNEMRESRHPEDPAELKAFYDGQRKGDLTKTSQISPLAYENAMRPWLEKGCPVLYLALSGGLSSTCMTAQTVAVKLRARYPGLSVTVVDTKAATGGMGILTERALRNRDAGMDIAENAADLAGAIARIRHWFLVQDLLYLQRGGRIGSATAAVGTILQIRPILKIGEDGKLQTIGKAHGTNKAVRDLLDRYEQTRAEDFRDPVYVIDADDPETGEKLRGALLEAHPLLTVRRCTLSPIIGAHTGPGMAAVIHIGR